MAKEEYRQAQTLEEAWLNFEPDLPLHPDPETGQPHPFYVRRPDDPADRLRRILLRPYREPPKLFFSGHRGSGKSTELARIAADPEVCSRFFPIHFSIRSEADINNLDYRDVLLIIASQLYRQYHQRGGKLDKKLLKEIDRWKGRVEESVQTTLTGPLGDVELDTRLDGFFAQVGAKIRLEPRTRHEIRQVLERDITGLISLMNSIATEIYVKDREKRPPLVLIDDLDKPDLDVARGIFYGHREIMLQPAFPIVYTVSSPLFYGPEFYAIRDRAVFLPNIKLITHADGERNEEGLNTLTEAIRRRMAPLLITPEAQDIAAEMSGGVFRELMRLLRTAVDRALENGREQVEEPDVWAAAAEIRGEYRRILTRQQRHLLARIQRTHQLDDPPEAAPLLQLLAMLEYANDEPWYDVHPCLKDWLEKQEDGPAE